ncbi:MAG: glycosyltransferase, partial [Helicobacter sp.]|nr:glycosyltransferase [Helicobacter sp.]
MSKDDSVQQTEEESKVGVIIPVFNTPISYLEECINSVLKQTYKNLQIILVDDGSTELEVLQTLKKYVKRDSRILFIRKRISEGVSAARNAAIDYLKGVYQLGFVVTSQDGVNIYEVTNDNPWHITQIYSISKDLAKQTFSSSEKNTQEEGGSASPDWIVFLDSDDYWDSTLVESCLKVAKREKVDVVKFSYNEIDLNGNMVLGVYNDVYDKDVMFEQLGYYQHMRDSRRHGFFPVWLFFINFDFYISKNLFFLPQIIHEDLLFCALLLASANKIYNLGTFKGYVYRKRKGSISDHTQEKEPWIPEFLGDMLRVFRDKKVVRELYRVFSFYVMTLYARAFAKHNHQFRIVLFEEVAQEVFARYFGFIHIPFSNMKRDTYFKIVFSLFFSLARNFEFNNPHYRPFKILENFDEFDDPKEQLCLDYVRELLY